MVILAAAALAATLVPQALAQVAPQRQARAMVTILSSAQLRFGEIDRDQPHMLRETRIRTADGSLETVRLVEFQ